MRRVRPTTTAATERMVGLRVDGAWVRAGAPTMLSDAVRHALRQSSATVSPGYSPTKTGLPAAERDACLVQGRSAVLRQARHCDTICP
jgi:hypothetical protein